jgi:hypothetical protein
MLCRSVIINNPQDILKEVNGLPYKFLFTFLSEIYTFHLRKVRNIYFRKKN